MSQSSAISVTLIIRSNQLLSVKMAQSSQQYLGRLRGIRIIYLLEFSMLILGWDLALAHSPVASQNWSGRAGVIIQLTQVVATFFGDPRLL